ncbi:hypothetical protein TRVL_04636 [Trypanosoma vivax]|nr:hypothetical protein TRVL_04636 [Trypanosoma vivax]
MGGAPPSEVAMPSGLQLKSLPAVVQNEVRFIAMTALRRLLYPILYRRIASTYRRKAIEQCLGLNVLGDGLALILYKHSVIGSCMQIRGEDAGQLSDPSKAANALSNVTLRLYLQGEIIQFNGEPSCDVLLVLKGSVRKGSMLINARLKAAHERRLSSSNVNIPIPSTEDGAQDGRTTPQDGERRGSINSTGSDSAPGEKDVVLNAPVVFGEYSTIGSFPWEGYLFAESSAVLVARISRSAYCAFLESFPKKVQKRLLLVALEKREKYLPRFAPMTYGRMRMCPLLSSLTDDNIKHLMAHLVPQVRPAGVQIGEQGVPQHIFFIRRGIVRLEREEGIVPEVCAPTQPKCRTLLVEGHTFGERQCIFREALGDSFHTLTNVDIYMLPFSVLVQFMKQDPSARTTIYASAKAASLTLEKFYEGMRFTPPSLDNLNVVVLGCGDVSRWIQRKHGNAISCARRVTIAKSTESGRGAKFNTGGRTEKVGVSPYFLDQVRKMPLVGLCNPDETFYMDCARCFRVLSCEAGEYIVRRGQECNRVLLFCQGGAVVVEDQRDLRSAGGGVASTSAWMNLPRLPPGCIVGYTCLRRHPWMCSIIAPDGGIEVWTLKRALFVDILRKHQLDRRMQDLVLQLMQPLTRIMNREAVLDMQPLLAPLPNSLWGECRLPNMHPISHSESVRFPIWKEGSTDDDPATRRISASVSSYQRH